MSGFDIENLRKWFLAERRDLPWRQNPTPYAVWVSEVMLQQTQVAVVIPYFEHWMGKFPTIAHLADAPLDEVIKSWEGLGYYSRARNLHAGARQVIEKFGGELPSDEKTLSSIRGLGPYTIGAIRAFAFRQKSAAVDGNVLRVLARYDALEEDISKAKTVKKIRIRAEELLPDKRPWEISEALIELGATLCSKKARCHHCPLRGSCKAFAQGRVNAFPVKSKKGGTEVLYRAVAVVIAQGRCLVRRGGLGEIMTDLHEFPYFETAAEGLSVDALQMLVLRSLQVEAVGGQPLESVRHGFTRYDARLSPVLFNAVHTPLVDGYSWMSFDELDRLAFSSGHRQIYQMVRDLRSTKEPLFPIIRERRNEK